MSDPRLETSRYAHPSRLSPAWYAISRSDFPSRMLQLFNHLAMSHAEAALLSFSATKERAAATRSLGPRRRRTSGVSRLASSGVRLSGKGGRGFARARKDRLML